MNLREIVGNLALLLTLALFISSLFPCKVVWEVGSDIGISTAPNFALILNCMLWFRYGTYIKDPVTLKINVLGLVINVAAVLFIASFSSNKMLYATKLLTLATMYGCLCLFQRLVLRNHSKETNLSSVAASITAILFTLSSFPSLLEAIKTGQAEHFNPYLLLIGLLVAFLWSIYGFLIGSKTISVINSIGFISTAAQCSLLFAHSVLGWI